MSENSEERTPSSSKGDGYSSPIKDRNKVHPEPLKGDVDRESEFHSDQFEDSKENISPLSMNLVAFLSKILILLRLLMKNLNLQRHTSRTLISRPFLKFYRHIRNGGQIRAYKLQRIF